MTSRVDAILRCPIGGEPLRRDGHAYVSASGRRWPIVRGVPRFVESDAYAASFGFQWNKHDRTQLDSRTGGTSSEDMLRQKTGLTPDQVRGKLVLDAGIGAGRFTDVLSRWGADVVGIDLSLAVEAANANFAHLSNVFVAQANIAQLPFARAAFDLVVSIGVLHHTPDTRAHFERLVPFLKPGGEACIWVYPREPHYEIRAAWTPFMRGLSSQRFYRWCRWFVPLAQANRGNPVMQYVRRLFPTSDQGLGLENDILDTFDGFSPYYHWIHDPDEVVGWFHEAGFVEVRTFPWTTSVRGRLPLG